MQKLQIESLFKVNDQHQTEVGKISRKPRLCAMTKTIKTVKNSRNEQKSARTKELQESVRKKNC